MTNHSRSFALPWLVNLVCLVGAQPCLEPLWSLNMLTKCPNSFAGNRYRGNYRQHLHTSIHHFTPAPDQRNSELEVRRPVGTTSGIVSFFFSMPVLNWPDGGQSGIPAFQNKYCPIIRARYNIRKTEFCRKLRQLKIKIFITFFQRIIRLLWIYMTQNAFLAVSGGSSRS